MSVLTIRTRTIFTVSVAKKHRALHASLHAVNMHYLESDDQIDVTPFLQEMSFLSNPWVAFLKMGIGELQNK